VVSIELIKDVPSVYYPGCPEDVILRYQDTVYRIAFTYCRNNHDAQDVTQEVFLRYLGNSPHLTGEDHLKAWLIRVTVNTSKTFLHSAWRRKTIPLDGQEIVSSDDKPDVDTYSAVMSLPEKYRSVVLLYYFDDYSVREIAHILCKKETTVQTQLQRARAKLKNILKEDWQDD